MGTVTLTMSEEDVTNLLFVADDMAEIYEDVANNLDLEDEDDPGFLRSVAHTLTEMAGVLKSKKSEEKVEG